MRRSTTLKQLAAAVVLSTLCAIDVIAGGVPNMKCLGTRTIWGIANGAASPFTATDSTDIYRFTERGDLFHSWQGRDEYRYNSVLVLEPGRYVSGHMTFLITDDQSSGYVVITDSGFWKVVYLHCVK
jgi:hypothetical protein